MLLTILRGLRHGRGVQLDRDTPGRHDADLDVEEHAHLPAGLVEAMPGAVHCAQSPKFTNVAQHKQTSKGWGSARRTFSAKCKPVGVCEMRARLSGGSANVRCAPMRPPDSCPQSVITTGFETLPSTCPHFSIRATTSIPLITLPKTTCFRLSLTQCDGTSPCTRAMIKNWLAFVFFPPFAIDTIPSALCFSEKFSSRNVSPYIDSPPAVQSHASP